MKKRLIFIGVGTVIIVSTAAAVFLLKCTKDVVQHLDIYERDDRDEFGI